MIEPKRADIIPEREKGFFLKKFNKFLRELHGVTAEIVPHDPEKTENEQREIQDTQSKINNFFLKSTGSAALIVCGKHHLLVSDSKENSPVTLQWEDHGGLLLKLSNPTVEIPKTPSTATWAKNNLKLSHKGEITTKRPPQTLEKQPQL